MQIATYIDGRAILFDEASRQLSIDGAVLSNDHVLGYDRAGQLAWVSLDTRSWFYQQAGVPLAAPPVAPPAKRRTSPLAWIAIVILIVPCLCGVMSAILSPVKEGYDSSKAERESLQSGESSGAAGVGSESGESGLSTVGEKAKTDKFEITIIAVETKKKVGSKYFEKNPAEGGEYVAVRWKYKNISREPIGMFSTPSLRLLNPDGTEFDPDVDASGSYATELELTRKIVSDLNPGITVEDAAVFEIQRGAFNKGSWRIFVNADEDVTFVLQ